MSFEVTASLLCDIRRRIRHNQELYSRNGGDRRYAVIRLIARNFTATIIENVQNAVPLGDDESSDFRDDRFES